MTKAAELAKIVDASGNVVTSGTVEPAGDTAAGDNAAIGFTSAEGIVITGQGSTNDVTIKNDADADVIEIPTGTTNVTVAGTLTATGFIIGSADINENDLESIDGITAGTIAASKAAIVDTNKDITGFRNITLTGELDAATLDISGNADIDGTLEADAMTLNGTAITATATLDTGISNNNVPKFTSGVADDDFLRVSGTAIEGRSASEVLSDIGASAVAGSSSIVTTGALNSGSITSGFGTIDTGSSTITTTGVGTFGSLDISGDIDVDGTTNLDVVDIDGAVDMASTLGVTGVITTNGGIVSNGDTNTFSSSAQDDPVIILRNTTNDSNSARFKFMKDRGAAGQDGDDIADFLFNSVNDAGEETTFASIRSEIIDASDGTEDGRFKITTKVAGTSVDRLQFNSAETIFNQDSVDLDFRVESNGNANMLFVDGGNDKIGIGLNSPGTSLHIRSSVASNIAGYRDGTTGLIVEGDAASYIQLVASKTNPMAILFDGGDTHNDTARGGIIYDIDTGLSFKSGGSTRWTINETGNLLPSATSLGVYLGVTSATASNLLNDYEEGTWTPALVGLSNTPSFHNNSGRYTKVGRVCTVQFFQQTNVSPTFSSGTAEFKISGLPFAVDGSGYSGSTGSVSAQALNYHGSNNTQGVSGSGSNGGAYLTSSVNTSEQMQFNITNSGGTRGILNNNGAAQGYIIEATVIYFTTD